MVGIAGAEAPDEKIRKRWVAIYAAWQAGCSSQELAQKFDLSARTIARKCGWMDRHMPIAPAARLRAEITRGLLDARRTLDTGDGISAERQAKAVVALVKAARALEDWTMNTSTTASSSETDEETTYDPKAELERRLLDYEERERKAELARRAQRQRGRSPGLELENMGEAQPDSTK